jgi:glycosyltransferase involved in cell wall biosynthesis
MSLSSAPPTRSLLVGSPKSLRVALLAGTLGPGGAEKQLVYMARTLRETNVSVRVYSLRRDEFYETALRRLNVEPTWIGTHDAPLLRLGAFVRALRTYRPHIIQSAHFFANLYVALAARVFGAVHIGSIRNDAVYDVEDAGRWASWLIRLPGSIIANSETALNNLKALGVRAAKCHVVPNVIDLAEFDAQANTPCPIRLRMESPVVVAVSTLARRKRLDRFLAALVLARQRMPQLRGVIIGGGPERATLERLATEQGLLPDGLQFLGRSESVPVLLRQADIFLLTSDHEGFPNVLLEAMAARLPVVTTPAGDAGHVVKDGVTGYVVSFDDVEEMTRRVLQLASSVSLRRRLGDAGRQHVEQSYGYSGLAQRLLATYRAIAEQQHHRGALRACLSCAFATNSSAS